MRDAQRVGGTQLHTLEVQRAVRIEHALRGAGSARGITQGGGSVFIEHGPVIDRGAAVEQLLVAVHIHAFRHRSRELIDVREDHRAHTLHAFEDVCQLLA